MPAPILRDHKLNLVPVASDAGGLRGALRRHWPAQYRWVRGPAGPAGGVSDRGDWWPDLCTVTHSGRQTGTMAAILKY